MKQLTEHGPTEPAQTELPSLRTWWVSLGIFSLAVLVYLNSFPGAFIQDDKIIVLGNPLVNAPDLLMIFRTEYWHGVESNGLYRPLIILSLALNRMLLGPGFWGYHLVNILLHAGAAVMFWLVLRRWGFSVVMAALSAALFAVHPLHGEVVNFIVGRSETLVVLFLLISLWFAHGQRRWQLLLVCSTFLLALLSKENAITFLAVLPVLDAFVARAGWDWRQRWRLYAGMVLTAGAWLIWRKIGLIATLSPSVLSPVAVPLAYVPWSTRILTGLELQWLYLGKLLLPLGLQMAYASSDLPPFVETLFSASGLLVTGSFGLLMVLVFIGWRQRQTLALFVLLYAIAFAPTSNIFFSLGVSFAERLAYFPSVWFCAGIGTLLAGVINKRRLIWVGWLMAGGYILFLATLGLLRNPDYSSELKLYTAEVQQNPRDPLGWLNLAESLHNSDRAEEADQAYQRTFSLAPDFAGALRSRTMFLIQIGRLTEAYASAQHALMLAQQQQDLRGEAADLVDLGSICLSLGQYEQALEWLARGAQLYGPQEAARYEGFRGLALAALGRSSEAIAAFRRVPESMTMGSDIPYEFALVLYKEGNLQEARTQLELAVRTHETAASWNLLGVVLVQQGQEDRAADAFGNAVELDPENLHYRENLQRVQQLTGSPPRQP